MTLVKISVIFPFFNGAYYIEEALDSVINQTIFDDIEVIIIDDGSTDNARFLVSKYAIDYENVHLFRKENGGVSSARNYAMKYAKGEYIHFMDADDYLMFDSLEKLYNLAKEDDYDIVSGSFLRFNSKKTWISTISKYVYKNIDAPVKNIQLDDYPDLTWDMLIWNKIYKREFLEKNNVQFANGLRFQDNVFSLEVLSKASKIALIPDYVYCWRVREMGNSATQTFNLKRMNDLIVVFGLVDEYIKNNISNKNVLSKKYLKWLVIDIPGYIKVIPSYPKEKQEFLLESIYDIFKTIPKEFTSDLNTHFSTLYEILENRDWDSLLLYGSNDYKFNPVLPETLKEEYKENIDFKKDALGEDLDIYTVKVSEDGKNINFKIEFKMPYISSDEEHKIYVKIVNSDSEYVLDSKNLKDDEFSIAVDSLSFGESMLMMTYKSEGIEKEYYLKTTERQSYSYDDYDVDIARGQSSYLRLIKRKKDESNYIIKEVIFEDNNYLELIGVSNKTADNILIKDYLNFVKFKYQMNYEKLNENNYKFSVKIPFVDILKAPVKKWDFYIDGEFNKINLEKRCEFINNQYRIFLKNHGNRTVVELFRYDSKDTITKLNNENNKLRSEKQDLIREKNRLIEDKKQLNKDKNKLNVEKEELKEEKNKLINEMNEVKENNKELKNKIKEYKNRKDVRTVDAIKSAFK